MPMNGTVLGDALISAIDTAVSNTPQAGPAQRQAIWRAIGAAIVTHVQGATVTVTVTSVSGVAPGPGVSGPGTGSGTIT